MKTIISFITLFVSLSYGKIIEIDTQTKTLYAHPTPQMEMTIVELDKNTGILYITMDYKSSKTTEEMDSIKAQYPGYEITVLQALVDGTVGIEIKGVLAEEFKMMQGQVGPLINMTLALNGTQLKALKSQRNQLASLIQLQVPVKFYYLRNQLIESYSVGTDFCRSLQVKNVRDLFMAFSKMQKPTGIKHEKTFISLKEQILDTCFNLVADPVRSFKELLGLKVEVENQNRAISGTYSARVESALTQNLTPNTRIEFR